MIDAFKEKKIAVLCAGGSNEKEVSIRSGNNVFESLCALGYQTELLILDELDYFNLNSHDVFFNWQSFFYNLHCLHHNYL